MNQLEALAIPAENHRVIADRVARAYREHRNLAVGPHPGDSFAAEHRVGSEIHAACRCDRLAQR